MKTKKVSRFWTIIIVAWIIITLILASWFIAQRISAKEVLETYNQQLYLIIGATTESIEAQMVDLDASLSSLRNLPEVQYLTLPSARSAIERKQEELVQRGVFDIVLLDEDGTAVIFANDVNLEGIDYSWRNYFGDAKERTFGEEAPNLIIEMQTIRANELGFVLSSPIYETAIDSEHATASNEFSGVLLAMLSVEAFGERYIAPFKPIGDGRIFLATTEFDIVWSSDGELTGQNLLLGEQGVFTSMVDIMLSWEEDFAAGGFYAYSESELIAFSPVQIGNQTMALGIWVPSETAQQTSSIAFRGQQYVFAASMITLFVGVIAGWFVLNRETKQRFVVEKALRSSEQEQAILEERNRLASDLHDSVTQGLYGIILHADAATGQIAAGQPEKANQYLEEIANAGQEGLAEMRLLIFELRPPILESEGLAAALETRLYTVEKRSGLNAIFQSTLEKRLPISVEYELYRIGQESLNNVLKHAKAKTVEVRLQQTGNRVVMEIKDDGAGFSVDEISVTGGMGLDNLTARSEKIEAELTINSHPGEGTTIRVELELET